MKLTGPPPPSSGKLGNVLALMSRRERIELLLLAPAIILMAILEVIGVASIIPFLGLLADPDAVDKNNYLAWLYSSLGFSHRESFFFAVGIGVLVLLTLSNLFSGLTTWALLRYSWMRNHTLSMRLLAVYLRRPYEFFLTRNTADLSKNILSEVQQAVGGVIVQGVQLLARVIVIALIIGALFFIDAGVAISVSVFFCGLYGGLFLLIRRYVARLGYVRADAQGERFKMASEILGGIKELKLLGLEESLLEQYAEPSVRFARAMASSSVLSQTPRFALETVGFGGIMVIVLYLLWQGRSLHDVLPVLGLYAFAAYRMLPGLQVVFAGLTMIRFNLNIVDSLVEELGDAPEREPAPRPSQPLRFETSVSLERITYTYPNVDQSAVRGVDLEIRRGEWIALVGPTGSGKSTLVDLILGLLRPTTGALRVDGKPLDEASIPAWHLNVGYVPQQIFLADDTVAKNIAFGVPPELADRAALETAARIAQIDQFVTTEMPRGYDTVVGERGIRMSGGQRQRLGIARALYRKPGLIVLDEATSALDGATEAAFFAEMRAALRDTTVISIAHRLSTTKGFDRVVLLERGEVRAIGAPEEAIEGRGHFQVLHARPSAEAQVIGHA